ncbi:MAG: hypothetical protein KAG95_06525, partial [Bacteroidales bacterium]|nr:hypothetical protein [Bacteroidales bacterium]
MKKLNLILVIAVLLSAPFFQSCEKDEVPKTTESIIPESFKVDIPDAISNANTQKSSMLANVDTLQGNDIYQNLRTFIAVGEGAADLVQDIMLGIAVYDINHAMSLSYESDEDGRIKNLEVIEGTTFEGQSWEYELTISDADGGKALQVFWNVSPVRGIAIIKPYNCNRNEQVENIDAMFKVTYSEANDMGYDKHMIVEIAGLPLDDPLENCYSVSSLKMFVGRNGDVVDVYGNTEHPNAIFINGDVGFDWAFVASSSKINDIAVAEVGLPSNLLDASDRETLLETYSIKNVFTTQIYDQWPTIDSTSVQTFLHNTEAPGFFDRNGFIQGGTAPNSQYDNLLTSMMNLTPYNPLDINGL